jgi:hypothetical protein
MITMKAMKISFAILFVTILTSCYYDNFGELKPESALSQSGCDTTVAISYSNQIVPLLQESCTGGCHNTISSSFDLTNYTAVTARVADGSLLGSVQWVSSFRPMPEASSKISDCDIAKIRLWISQGALNN